MTRANKQRAGKSKNFLLYRVMMLLAVIGLSASSGAMLHANAMGQSQAADLPPAAETPAKTFFLLSVEPGDTLWEIAERYGPEDVGVKSYVQQIIAFNALESSQLKAGQVLKLPN